MRKRHIYTIITDHSDQLIGIKANEGHNLTLSPADQSAIAPFLQLNERLKETLVPVTPSAEFRTGLKDSLLAGSLQHMSSAQNSSRVPLFHRKWVIIGAAAGSAISVAGIVAAVLLRQRYVAHT